MCEREHLAAYIFKEAFPEADTLWFGETKQTKIKGTEHLERLYQSCVA